MYFYTALCYGVHLTLTLCRADFDGNWGDCSIWELSEWSPMSYNLSAPTTLQDWQDCGVSADTAISPAADGSFFPQIQIQGSYSSNRFKPPTIGPATGYDHNKKYTIMMHALDRPSREDAALRQVLQWMVVNLDAEDMESGRMENGDTWVEYFPPVPINGTGYHRYVFLVYAQSQQLNIGVGEPYPIRACICGNADPMNWDCPSLCPDLGHRMKQNAKQWAADHRLEGPKFGTFVILDYDIMNSASCIYVDVRTRIALMGMFIYSVYLFV